MTISAMGNKCVVLGLTMCLLLSSLKEVSCQFVGGSASVLSKSFDDQESISNLRISKEEESESLKTESEHKFIFDKSSTQAEDFESGALGGHDDSSSMMDKVNREVKAHFDDLNKQAGRSENSFDSNGERVLELESDRKREESATKYVEELKISKEKSKVETSETKFGGDDKTDDEDGKSQIYYRKDGKESDKNPKFTSNSYKIVSEEAASIREQYESNKSSGGSWIMGSLGLGQSGGSWRCFDQDKNGIKEEEDAPLVIPKYEIDQIIKEESISQGSESKASSLVASLTKIVETHKNTKWTSSVEIGKKTRKSSETVRLETVEALKLSLIKYRSLSVRDLVDHPQFEEMLAIAARYEEVTFAKVSHISRLSMYKSVIIEGRKASERVKLAYNRIRLHEDIVKEKQSNVDAEFASVKALAQRGDMLKVKIFAIKKLLLRLEAEKEEVDINFQKTVGNLSHVLEEASQAEEKYHLVVRKWKEEKASAEFSQEAIQNAEVVWVQFLSTLKTTYTTN